MSRVIAVVEGQTEQTFVRNVLAPQLGSKGVALSARLVGKPGRKGGVGTFIRARNDIISLLKQEPDTYVTTMFDFYGMPDSWPGRRAASQLIHVYKATAIENAIHERIAEKLGTSFDGNRLIPYVQMHEFEALLFSEPSVLSQVMREPNTEDDLVAIRNAFDSPEEIDDDPNTAPSRRLQNLYGNYRKRFHGTLAAIRITVDVMREQCPHFNEWIESLEALGTKPN